MRNLRDLELDSAPPYRVLHFLRGRQLLRDKRGAAPLPSQESATPRAQRNRHQRRSSAGRA
eukprot:1386258-Pleurochrysis_carterae.AAC.1